MLAGKVAVVTGAAQGAGRTIAQVLGTEGARVVIVDLLDGGEALAELQAAGIEAPALHADVTSEEATREMVAAAADRFGGIDCPKQHSLLWPARSAFTTLR